MIVQVGRNKVCYNFLIFSVGFGITRICMKIADPQSILIICGKDIIFHDIHPTQFQLFQQAETFCHIRHCKDIFLDNGGHYTRYTEWPMGENAPSPRMCVTTSVASFFPIGTACGTEFVAVGTIAV